MPEQPFTVRLLPPTTQRPAQQPSRSHNTTTNNKKPITSTALKARRSHYLHHHTHTTTPRITLVNLPAALLLSSVLPFLHPHHKLTQLSHISRSFPSLDPTAFRHDSITLTTQQSAWFPKLHPSYLQLVSSCHSLWLHSDDHHTSHTSHSSTSSRDDIKRDVLLSLLTITNTFNTVRRLRIPLPSVNVFPGPYLARLMGAGSDCFKYCYTVVLDDMDGLRKLTIEQVKPLTILNALRHLRLVNCRLPLSTIIFLTSSTTLPTLVSLDMTDCWYAPFDVSSIHPTATAAAGQSGTAAASVSRLRHLLLPSRSEGKAAARCTVKLLQHLATSSARASLSSLSLRGQACGAETGPLLSSFTSLTSLSIDALELDFLHSLYDSSSSSDSTITLLPCLQHVSLSCQSGPVATEVTHQGSLQSMLYTFISQYHYQLLTIQLELPYTTLLTNLLHPLSTCTRLLTLHLTVRSASSAAFDAVDGAAGWSGGAVRAVGGGGLRELQELVLEGVEWNDAQLRTLLQAAGSHLQRLKLTRMEHLTATTLQLLPATTPILTQLHLSALHCAPPHQLLHLQQLTQLQLLGGLEYDSLPRTIQGCVYPPPSSMDDDDDDDAGSSGAGTQHWEQDSSNSSGSESWIDGGPAAESAVLWCDGLRFVARVSVKKGKEVSGRVQFFQVLDQMCVQNEKKSHKRGGPRKQQRQTQNVT